MNVCDPTMSVGSSGDKRRMRKSPSPPFVKVGNGTAGMRRADGCPMTDIGHDHVVEADLRNSLWNVVIRKSPSPPFVKVGKSEWG
jgi:hypothetical protein